MNFNTHSLVIDAHAESERICSLIVESVRSLRRKGAVIGISGGVDSSVVLALCARIFPPDHICALILPETDSAPESVTLAHDLAAGYGITPVVEDISPCLDIIGSYRRRDDAIRRVFSEYDPARGYRVKITLPADLLERDALSVFNLTVQSPTGEEWTNPLPVREFTQIVAASNFKQRVRMMMLYYYAELNHYAVIGTANKDEHDLGFFVKYGDGGADVKPLAHLFKIQVYQLAEYLGVPEAIRRRTPTTDTYSAPATQEEFFFRLPFETLDLLWFAMENGIPNAEVAAVMGISDAQVERAQAEIRRKQRAAAYLLSAPLELATHPNLVSA